MPETPPPLPPPPKKRINPLWFILGGCLIPIAMAPFLLGLALPVFNQVKKRGEEIKRTAAEQKEFVSEDKAIKVIASGRWRAMDDLHEEADLQMGHRSDDTYVIVLRESKEDFAAMTLQGHSDLTRGSMAEVLADPSVGEGRTLTIGGHPALQYQIEGEASGVNVVYLHTTVDDGTHFNQILAWTLKSKFPAKKAELQAIIESFESAPAHGSEPAEDVPAQ